MDLNRANLQSRRGSVRCVCPDGQPDVLLLHGIVPANELPLRVCGGEVGFAMGCNLGQWIYSARPLDTLPHQLELLPSLGWSNNHVSRSALTLQLAGQSDN